jgi:4-aminobutyrate aminotransferase-like enzyme
LVITKEAKPVQQALFKKGIITGPNSNPKLVHLLPPMTIQTSHVDQLFTALEDLI